MPVSPESDPQFKNWEGPVLNWARINLPDFASYNQPGAIINTPNNTPTNQPTSPVQTTVQITSPTAGSFVQSQMNINFVVQSSELLKHIDVFMNDALFDAVDTSNTSYTYLKQFNFADLNAQNELKVIAETASGKKMGQSVIFYK